MGFLDGFLSGVNSRQQQIEAQNREDAQASQQRETAVLSHLMTSDDPEIKSLAVAGMLDSTQPKKRKGGFAGWLGEMQNNPHMDRIRALVAHDQAVGHMVPSEVAHAAGQMTALGDPASAAAITTAHVAGGGGGSAETTANAGTPTGSPETPGIVGMPPPKPPPALTTPAPPSPAGAAAMPANSPTEKGSAPPSNVSGGAGPSAAAPSMPGAPGVAASPTAVLGRSAPLPATPGGPPASATKPGIHPGAVLGQPAPVGAGPLSPRGDVFRSPETQVRKDKAASAQGDVEGEMAGLMQAGYSQQQAAEIVRQKMNPLRAGGMARSVAGEAPDENGKFGPAFGIFDPVSRTYSHPETGEVLQGFRPKSATTSMHYGVGLEAASQRLYGKPFGQLSQPEQDAAQKEVETTVGRTATARGEGTNAAKLNAPIGVLAAQRYGVPATTTLSQLQERIPLSAQDADKIHGISQLEGTLNNIDELLPKVFPDVGPGLVNRIKTGLSLFSQGMGRQPDITKLNSEIASVMPEIVKVNGVTQRLNQKEIDFAQQQMVNTSALHGDTLESAQAKMQILRDLVKRVQVGGASLPAPGTAGQIGTPPPATAGTPPPGPTKSPATAGAGAKATVPGFTMVNGQLYKDGKPY